MAAEADHAGGLPQLDFSTWPSQIFWLVISLTVLYIVLTRFALPKLEDTLAERADTIARDLDRANEFNKRAEETLATFERKLADARAEARKRADEAKVEAAAQLKRALAEADARIEAQLAASETRLRAIQAEAQARADEVAQAAAAALADRFGKGGVDRGQLAAAVSDRVRTQFGG